MQEESLLVLVLAHLLTHSFETTAVTMIPSSKPSIDMVLGSGILLSLVWLSLAFLTLWQSLLLTSTHIIMYE